MAAGADAPATAAHGPALPSAPSPDQQCSLPARGTAWGGAGRPWASLPPSRCLAGARVINDMCHSVRREGWVSDV